MKSRLAPTPSGYLHEGNALNFILTWWFTRFNSGELLLRIDDSDEIRTRTKYLEDIFRVVDWLGIDYDKGPSSVEDHQNNFSQTLKKDYYYSELQKHLKDELFACSCTRKDLSGSSSYPGTCLDRNLSFSKGKTCLRFQKELKGSFDKMILWRKDDGPAYQLVSVLEDRDSEITHIIRGDDLLESSRFQKILFNKISDADFPKVFHHDLVVSEKFEKLSKSQGDLGVRKKFKNREEFFKKVLWPFLGKNFEGISLEELSKTPPEYVLFKEAY